MRVGIGYDSHRLVAGRPLVLGGVHVPYEKGEQGHSDGDALIHAVIDALLGACAREDIGAHFPPGDPRFAGISSRVLLRETSKIVRQAGYRPVNVDCTVILQTPRLRPFVAGMRENMARDLELEAGSVSVKAKTAESLGPVGEGLAVEAHAAALLETL